MIHRPFSTAMVDLLLCTVVLLTLLINPPADKKFDAMGDYQIHMRWDDDTNVDIDMYLALPEGGVVWFSAKNLTTAYLTRDDMGTNHGDYNQEVIWLETPTDGTYCLSVHNYSTRPNPNITGNKLIQGDITLELLDRDGTIMYKHPPIPMMGWKEEVGAFCFEVFLQNIIKDTIRPSDLRIRDEKAPDSHTNQVNPDGSPQGGARWAD